MRRLTAPIRPYAWGSRTAIASMQGRPVPADGPEAELWLGAHPSAPAVLADSGIALDEAIATDPAGLLGPAVVDEFGPRLPFLLKLLAAAEPLSLQAHPTPEQAVAGFDADDAAGVARDAPERTYVDRHHKPELLVAVEEFDALCGFRPPHESADLLADLGVPLLDPVIAELRRPDPSAALRGAVTALLTMPAPGPLVAANVGAALGTGSTSAGVGAQRAPTPRAGGRPDVAVVEQLAATYPGDAGVVLALLLNRVRLAPGEAIWMPAGNMHAYLRGVGVEIMAASDNVLRGGLTRKRVNVPELLRVLRFEVLADPLVRPVAVSPGLCTWPVPVPDFALFRAVVDGTGVEVPGTGPRVALCLRGGVSVDDGVTSVTLGGGDAAFAEAGTKPLQVTGSGELYMATVGR